MIPTKARNRAQQLKDRKRPRTPDEFFSMMEPATRQRLYRHFQKFAWEFAIATATAHDQHGRIVPPMSRAVGVDIMSAALEVFAPATSVKFK